MVEDTFDDVMHDLKEAVTDPRTPSDVRKAVLSGVKRLEEFFDEEPEEDPEDEVNVCPDCGAPRMTGPTILQIIPKDGWKAVFAETDENDPQAMSVEDVVFFALVEFPDGYRCISGMYVWDDEILPCWPVRTFVGYVPPGRTPDMYAEKVRQKLKVIGDGPKGD